MQERCVIASVALGGVWLHASHALHFTLHYSIWDIEESGNDWKREI